MGVHRSLTPDDDQLDILGAELIAWCLEPVKKGEEKHILFSQWYSIKKHILRDTWKAMIKHPTFRPYYEQAQSILGIGLITGSIKEGIAHRFIRLYHADVREDEDEIKKMGIDQANEFMVKVINYSNKEKEKIERDNTSPQV